MAVAVGAFVWTLAGVQALVELEVDELGELCRAELAVVRLLPRVKAQVGFQVAGAAEAFVTDLEETEQKLESATYNNSRWNSTKLDPARYLAFVWLLARVDQVVLL